MCIVEDLYKYYFDFISTHSDSWYYSVIAGGPMEVVVMAYEESGHHETFAQLMKSHM